ncbi:flagellar hook-associated protein 2 [Bacillus sp. JJ634]
MVMRVSGLASGMDIDDIVSKLMTAQRVPLDKLYQKKTYTEWQRDDYRTVNTALSELDTLIRDGIGKQASFIKKTITVSNPDAVSVRNINSTSDFSGTIKVNTLATASTIYSNTATEITDSTAKLSTYGIATQEISIRAMNKSGQMETKNVIITEDDTMDSLITKINSQTDVNAFFDKDSKKISFAAKYTGNSGEGITLNGDVTGDGSKDFFKMIFSNDERDFTANTGGNAKVEYNGMLINRSSNIFTINGAEITLKKEMAATEPPVTFSSTADVDTIFDTVKKFVDSYNGLIATISSKTSEKKNSGYPPLTDEQKKEMTEDQVKKWEEQARKGTLRRDSTLTSLLTKMRTSLYTQVEGTSLGTLDQIGITTTKNYLEGGKLEIDEEKLKAAIAEDPNAIYELFMQDGDSKEGKQGIARRLRAELSAGMKTISEKAGSASSVNSSFTLGKLLNEYDKKIDSFNDRLTALETRYYKQFTAMETAINKANSQSTSLMQYFS